MTNGPTLKKVRRPINRSLPISDVSPKVAPDNNLTDNSGFPASQGVSKEFSSNSLPSVNTESNDFDNMEYNQYDKQPYYEEEYYDNNVTTNNRYIITNKTLIISIMISLFLGLIVGHLMLGNKQVTYNGLQGVVVNSEVPRGRARCGVADRSQGCVLYIMNPQRQNTRAKDFYDLAAQLTGRQKYMIETGNMRYANTEIRPGDIVQLNIPPL